MGRLAQCHVEDKCKINRVRKKGRPEQRNLLCGKRAIWPLPHFHLGHSIVAEAP
jgi:hypothetical protein